VRLQRREQRPELLRVPLLHAGREADGLGLPTEVVPEGVLHPGGEVHHKVLGPEPLVEEPSGAVVTEGVELRLDLPRFRGDPETGGNSLRKELTMPRSRPPYPREFREEAVRLVRSSGRPIAQIARELGIAHGTLSAWVKQAELDAGLRSDGLTTAEREELRRLRRENRILREEREILKKAAAFFARETESKP
jgi:transposase